MIFEKIAKLGARLSPNPPKGDKERRHGGKTGNDGCGDMTDQVLS